MNQFFTFMVDWSLKSVATVAMASVCVLLLRRRSAATRHLIWRITLSAVALLPLAMVLASKEGAPAVMEPIQAPVRAVIFPLVLPKPVHAIKNRELAAVVARAETAGTSEEQIAGFIYAVGFLSMLAAWIAGYLNIRRVAKRSAPSSGVSSPHRVLVASDRELRVPITFGLSRPVILLPKGSEDWPEQRVRAAILHESAHIARKDWAWQTASAAMRAMQWFNPAIWLMNGALQATSETATDDEVLTQFGMGASAYAGELLKVAECARGNFGAATAMVRPGGVAARVRRIVAKGVDRAIPRRRFAVGVGLAFSAGAVLVAAGTVAEARGGTVGGRTARSLRIPPVSSLISMIGAALPRHEDGDYEAKLPHGGVVRVVALTGPRNAKGPMWRPDGSSATKEDRTLLQSILDQGNTAHLPNERIINFYLQVSKLPMKPGETENGIFRIKSPDGWEYRGGANTFAPDGRLQWDRWKAPATALSCDMDCAISYGAYHVVGRGKLGDGQFGIKMSEQGGDWTALSVHLPGKADDNEAKLECFDHDGNPIPGGGEQLWGSDDGKNGQEFQFQYRTPDAKKIESFQLSTRDYVHVLIKGIQLPPSGIQP